MQPSGMGKGIADGTRERIRHMIKQERDIADVKYLFSTYRSPQEILLLLIITIKENLDTSALDELITTDKQQIRTEFPLIKYIIIEPELAETVN